MPLPLLSPSGLPRRKSGLTNLEPIGHCVRCGHRINWQERHARVAGTLGKVCADCVTADDDATEVNA